MKTSHAAAAVVVACALGGSCSALALAKVQRPARATAPSAVVWAVGDGADGSAAAKAVVAQISARRIDRLLYLGDVYGNGTAQDFAAGYAPVYGKFARITSPTPGNHDWPNRATGYNAYWASVKGRPPQPYYRSSLAGWDILSLNSEADHSSTSPQLQWLRRQVRRGGTCRLAFWHRPRYSFGTTHGDNPDVQPFWDVLRGHATIVLNGHEHDMQRFRPRTGITEFVSGAGGHSLYPIKSDHPGLVFGDATDYGALRLVLRPGVARFAFVSSSGKSLDAGKVRCQTRRR